MNWYKFQVTTMSGGKYLDIDYCGYIQAESEENLREKVFNLLLKGKGQETAECYIKFLKTIKLENGLPDLILLRNFYYMD